MSPLFAEIALALLGLHLGIGVVFAIAFQACGIGAIDAAAAHGSRGFRIAITPGVVALWPLLLRRWLHTRRTPS